MKTDIRRTGSVVVFKFQGGLDRGDLPAIEKHLNESLAAERPLLVIDLSEATFLSSSALGLFVRARKAAKQAGGDVVLARPSHFVISVLATLGLDRVFWIHASEEAAVASLAAREASSGGSSRAVARPN